MALEHALPIEWLAHPLVTGSTVHLTNVSGGPKSVCRLDGRQRHNKLVVHLPHHANAMPGGGACRRALLPLGKGPRVVAEGAVHAEALAHMHHQRIRPFALHGRLAIARGQCRIANHPNRLVFE